MQQSKRLEEFKKSVTNKFNIYNSLFLSLPYKDIENVGILIPVLLDQCERGLKEGKDPREILETFFSNFANMSQERERLDFMFRIIQYVERQVVLYDAVEDSAFPKLQQYSNSLSIKDYFELVNRNKNWDKVSKKLSSFSARIVLTAHPTQFYTPAVLDIIAELRSLIEGDKIHDIDVALQQLGLTSLINAKKPTPLDEAKNIIYILRNTYYGAIGELYQDVKGQIRGGNFENHNLIKLGFWPGGDRDGNPYVTAQVSRKVADELRLNLMKCYYNELKELRKKLTFQGLQDDPAALGTQLYKSMFDPKVVVSYRDIIAQLMVIREKLIADYHGLYLGLLDTFIDRVHIFKTHFASLDIRQDHSKHHLVVETVLKREGVIKENLSELGDKELQRLLLKADFQLKPSDYQ